MRDEKGDRSILPERPEGCCAQNGPVPFFSRPRKRFDVLTFRRFDFSSSAFSLLELLIAIMILGIGVVMVATVFPVGIEISRQPIQAYIDLAIADTAVNTLQTKVPAYRELDQIDASSIPVAAQRVLVPDTYKLEVDTTAGTPCELTVEDYEVVDSLFLTSGASYLTIPFSYPNWQPAWLQGYQRVLPVTPLIQLQPPAQSYDKFIAKTRVFTERTGWSGEVNAFTWAYPIPSQNLPAGGGTITAINDIPVMVHPSFKGFFISDLPRVCLTDQVYPPITRQTAKNEDRSDTAVIADLLLRRYSWVAFHHRLSAETPQAGKLLTNRDILTTIVSLHRADVGARFARQLTLDTTGATYQVNFNLSDPDHLQVMYQPQADTAMATDSAFPRPWLAIIRRLNAQAGEATVAPELARLLPEGAFFIIARTSPLNSYNGYSAGMPIQVTRSEWDPATLGATLDATNDSTLDAFTAWTRIEIARSNIGQTSNVPVWVFPPAVSTIKEPRDTPTKYEFATRSPVVGVQMRRIPVQ